MDIFPSPFLVPQKTLFRCGTIKDLARECLLFGERGLIVHGKSFFKEKKLELLLGSFPKSISVISVCHQGGEPTLLDVERVIQRGKKVGAEWIAGVGGGSVLDLAKAAAGLFQAKEDPEYYQLGGKLLEKGIPFIAVPTTAGTGAEATSNAVIINKTKRKKLSIRDDSFMARTVVLDPDLIISCPKEVIAYSGMDALVQSIEAYFSRNSTWYSEIISLKAYSLILESLEKVYENSGHKLRRSLLLGSYLGAVAFSHTRLGVIHGLVHPLGAIYNQPHGLLCAIALVPALKLNRDTVKEKYRTLSQIAKMDLIDKSGELIQKLNIVSPLKCKEIRERDKIIEETISSGSSAANPKPIGQREVSFLLKEIFG